MLLPFFFFLDLLFLTEPVLLVSGPLFDFFFFFLIDIGFGPFIFLLRIRFTCSVWPNSVFFNSNNLSWSSDSLPASTVLAFFCETPEGLSMWIALCDKISSGVPDFFRMYSFDSASWNHTNMYLNYYCKSSLCNIPVIFYIIKFIRSNKNFFFYKIWFSIYDQDHQACWEPGLAPKLLHLHGCYKCTDQFVTYKSYIALYVCML